MSSFAGSSSSSSESSLEPLQLGVSFRPPAIILLYRDPVKNKTRRRSMPARGISKTSDCYSEAQALRRRHPRHLGPVPAVRIEKFLRVLQETMKGRTLEGALEAAKRDFAIDFDEDMNKLSDQELQRRKEIMDVNFAKNQIKVGDPDFVWDKKVVVWRIGSVVSAHIRGELIVQ